MTQIKRLLIRSLLLISVIYFSALGLLYSYQGNLIYLPNLPGRELHSTPDDIGLGYQDVWLTTEDGTILHSWFVPAEKSKAVVLVYHGNAGNISHRLETIWHECRTLLSQACFYTARMMRSFPTHMAWHYLMPHENPNSFIRYEGITTIVSDLLQNIPEY